jgi:hypothetical protein
MLNAKYIVKLYCEEKNYKNFKEVINKYKDKKPNRVQFVNGNNPHYIITWNNVECSYPFYSDNWSKDIQRAMQNCGNGKGNGYKLLYINLDNISDHLDNWSNYNERGFKVFEKYHLTIQFTEPQENVENIEM